MRVQYQPEPMRTAEGVSAPIRILAVDVGAGTQDILIYQAGRELENCPKLVLPSQTQIVGERVRAATAARQPLHLTGTLMGGGASSDAVRDHLAAGLPVTATSRAARTLHNDPNRVREMGVALRETPAPDAAVVELRDLDLAILEQTLAPFGIELPETVAVALQDHGYRPGAGNNDVRFEYLTSLLAAGGDLVGMVYQEPPDGMTRMAALLETVPGAYLMDTGAAAVLGAMGDPVVAAAAGSEGAILVNVGNMHTFAVLVQGRRLLGLFEHHTGGMTQEIIAALVDRLRDGSLDAETFRRDFDGHGAAIDDAYHTVGPFSFIAVTGPNRRLARGLGYHEAAPHGDMMLAGAYGLVEGVLAAQGATSPDR